MRLPLIRKIEILNRGFVRNDRLLDAIMTKILVDNPKFELVVTPPKKKRVGELPPNMFGSSIFAK